MFEDLPVELSQQEERMLQSIVIPDVTKGETRRNVILVTVVVPVVMLGMIWGLCYIPMGDLSKYKSFADTAYSILPIGVIFWAGYLAVKSIKLRNELIQKLYHALSSIGASEADTKTTDD